MTDKDLQVEISQLDRDKKSTELAASYGLTIGKVTWEDTGRSEDSVWGPNISDMTLRVARSGLNMNVIRPPNFTDKTTDRKIKEFNVVVGNEDGSDLRRISLEAY